MQFSKRVCNQFKSPQMNLCLGTLRIENFKKVYNLYTDWFGTSP